MPGYSASGFIITHHEIVTVLVPPELRILVKSTVDTLHRNPALPPETLTLAVAELSRDRSLLSAVQANREVHLLSLVKVLKLGTGTYCAGAIATTTTSSRTA
jgi:hypothetical protein